MTSDPNFTLQRISRLLFFVINIIALYLLLRGHEMPGGGFIAGLVSGISFALLGLGVGPAEQRRMLPFDSIRLSVIGLGIAVASAGIALFVGDPFFMHYHAKPDLPLLGKVYLGTALLFDIGVYLVVLGISVKILHALFESTEQQPPIDAQEQSHFFLANEEPIDPAEDEGGKS